MRLIIIVVAILAFALLAFSYTPQATLEISVTELSHGIKIDNMGNVACIVFVNSVEGQQRFELPTDQSIVIIGITKPIAVSAVSK